MRFIINNIKKSPKLYRLGQFSYWKYKEVLLKLIGTREYEKYWANRHRAENDWIERFWESRNHEHRKLLFQTLEKNEPFSSILEVGCNCGPNLYWLAKKYPMAQIVGIDINSESIQEGKNRFLKEKISNVSLFEGKADMLERFADKSFDVVFTDAVLMYIGPDKIKRVISEMCRVARRNVLAVEWHSSGLETDANGLGVNRYGKWIRNYPALFENNSARSGISNLIKMPGELWPDECWKKYGYITEVSFK